MAADNAAAWPRDAEIPLTDVRSVPKTGLARPPPTQQTARKGRLNFLYAIRNPAGVTKASGLAEVCRVLGIGMEQAVAVGDSLNDLAMIKEAGLGVAMGNAQEAVKQAADEVVAGNEEDGVAEAIRRFVFGEA